VSISKYLSVGAILFAASLPSGIASANEIEIISVTEGGSSATQNYDLVLIVQQLQSEVRSLRGKVESQQYELDSLKAQQKEMYADLDGRLGGSSFNVPPKSVSTSEKASAVNATAILSGDEQQDYSAAFSYIKSQELAKAEAAFSEYMKRHPKAKRVSNALYWLGEVNLAQGKLAQASGYFEQLKADFPKSAKIPDAMYKLGRVYQRMGKASEAVNTWQNLVDAYPNAAAASLAKNALK